MVSSDSAYFEVSAVFVSHSKGENRLEWQETSAYRSRDISTGDSLGGRIEEIESVRLANLSDDLGADAKSFRQYSGLFMPSHSRMGERHARRNFEEHNSPGKPPSTVTR